MSQSVSSYIWVRTQNCDCLVPWFCYQLIAKPGNKTAAVSWPDPYLQPYTFKIDATYTSPWCNETRVITVVWFKPPCFFRIESILLHHKNGLLSHEGFLWDHFCSFYRDKFFLCIVTLTLSFSYIEGILPKGPYLPCVSMAGRTFWQDTLDM